jgi:response regulator RpfG family c-di-GMP phosphodiesterase
MLLPIEYLRPATDIPYCHHERWDGSGYPRGLRGDAIPLAARLFAVVDVWDALCSDRYYRQGWPEKKVLAYLQSEAGKHFDPHAVDLFVLMREAELQGQDSASSAGMVDPVS